MFKKTRERIVRTAQVKIVEHPYVKRNEDLEEEKTYLTLLQSSIMRPRLIAALGEDKYNELIADAQFFLKTYREYF